MSEYTPDVWQVIKLHSTEHGTHYRVLAGWYGGYLYGDSWKLNSGITRCEYDDDFWYFYGESGSCYKCHKDAERLSGLTASILSSFQKQFEDKKDGSYISVVESYTGEVK